MWHCHQGCICSFSLKVNLHLNVHTLSFKILRLDAPYPVWKLGGAVRLSAECSAPLCITVLQRLWVSCLLSLVLRLKHLPGGGAFVPVYIMSASAFTYSSIMIAELLTWLCCVIANVSIDTILHLTPTELHNLAIETGTHKSAYIQKHWHADTLTFLIAALPLWLSFWCEETTLPVLFLCSDSEILPMTWSLMLTMRSLGVEWIYQADVFEL